MDGFRIGTILPSFQKLGMKLCWIDRSKLSIRAPMATGPNCFRCLYEIPSGPTDEVGIVCSVAFFVMLGLKGAGRSFCGRSLRCALSIFLYSVLCGSLEMDE